MSDAILEVCRLCEGPLSAAFTKTVLGKHEVGYFTCAKCGSLQTEPPFWLDECYRGEIPTNTDTGKAQRNINNLVACYAISKLFGLKNIIDIGGGDGLLCRMLRDYGFNCYVTDKYADPTYALGFTEPDFSVPDLVIGFEVLEHLPNPATDLDDIFGQRPRALLLTTAIYSNQSDDWWYLVPEAGQHVFFYSHNAMQDIAKRYGYSVIISGGYLLFIEDCSSYMRSLVSLILKGRFLRLLKPFVVLLPTPGVQADHIFQLQKTVQYQREAST